jgi:hypothetical protein
MYKWILVTRIITNSMHCLSAVYWVITPLHVLGVSGSRMYICGKWYSSLSVAQSDLLTVNCTICHTYTFYLLMMGLDWHCDREDPVSTYASSYSTLCAPLVIYFSSVISRGACAAPDSAALSQVGPEPLGPIGVTQSPLLATKESMFPPSSTGAQHRSERAAFSRKSPEPLKPSGALYQRGRKALGENWQTKFCLNDSTST